MTAPGEEALRGLLPLGDGEEAQPRSLQEYVAARLRAAILGGAIPPGTRLRQAQIAAQLSVSITPVREALRILTTEGLVDTNTFNGWWVHVPTHTDVLDIYRVRTAICPLVVADSVGNISAAELDRAREVLAEMDRCDELAEWVRLNRQFHRILEGSVPGRLLANLQERLTGLSQMYVSLAVGLDRDKQRVAQADHRRLLDAYERRDKRAATTVARRHLRGSLQSSLDALGEGRQ